MRSSKLYKLRLYSVSVVKKKGSRVFYKWCSRDPVLIAFQMYTGRAQIQENVQRGAAKSTESTTSDGFWRLLNKKGGDLRTLLIEKMGSQTWGVNWSDLCTSVGEWRCDFYRCAEKAWVIKGRGTMQLFHFGVFFVNRALRLTRPSVSGAVGDHSAALQVWSLKNGRFRLDSRSRDSLFEESSGN